MTVTDSTPDVSDHAPTTAVGDGRERCEACGYLWPCPDVRMQPRQLDDDEKVLLEIELASIDIGYSVRKRLPAGAEYDAPGGIVVGTFTDENGQRCFRAQKFVGRLPRTTVLTEAEIEPASVCLPRSDLARAHARRLAELVGRGRGAVSSDEVEMLSDALRVMVAVA